ncbi:carbon-nitrogen hydrolase family protein [Thiobacillus sp.]|uniref:carbon-nitrogen hydrolase family protein n=1 Tax=Thiobacillus sp. TaxID=924 RepID=UPI0025CF878A|nr:carbon-nitrogen hydrolase family protein [Thiobacillus sp.]MBT9539691.1 carbon-nitrogen hydrolase family protein [Thiobacillus sp.]
MTTKKITQAVPAKSSPAKSSTAKPGPGKSSVARPKGAQVKKSAPQADTVRVAAIQMASGSNVSANLAEAEQLIELAVEAGARLVALPEFFCIMGLKDSEVVKAREPEGSGPIQSFLSRMAKKHRIWLIGGSVPLEASVANKVRNSCLVYDERGKQVGRYDKIHLFGLDLGNEHYQEAKLIEPGDSVVVINSPFGRIGLSICYDLRFPELYRAMPEVDLIVVPSAFTATTGRAHFEALIRARAIENLAYVIAPAQGGYHLSGRETHGDSMIVDPWGVVLDRLPRGSGVVIANINPAYQASLRNSLPALKHRFIKCEQIGTSVAERRVAASREKATK